MGVYRLYTGSDGESHIEEISLKTPEDTTGKGHTTTYPEGLTITMQIAPNA